MSEAYTNVPGQRLDIPDPTVSLSGTTMGGASYKVLGTIMQTVVVHLRAGQTVYTETGALSWMQEGIRMDTNMRGGLGGILGRVFTGESLFVANFTAGRDNAMIAFSAEFPGKIIPLNLALHRRAARFLPGSREVGQHGGSVPALLSSAAKACSCSALTARARPSSHWMARWWNIR